MASSDKEREAKLIDAARDGNLEDVITLLDQGTQIDATDWVRNIVVDVVFRHVRTSFLTRLNQIQAGDSAARRA
ncbi:hypothetical protein EMCRGX_G011568 [Ephydatia muelleri]